LSLCTNKLIPTLSRFRFVRRKREEIKYRRICPKLFWPPKIEYCFWLGLELAKTLGHVCLSIWLCVNLSVCPSVWVFFLRICSQIYQCLSFCLCNCMCACLLDSLFNCISVRMFVCKIVCTCMSTFVFVYLFVCRFNFLFVVLSVWPFLPIGI
jgi:hypothetical protein